MSEGVREQGWIIAAKRRDGGVPSFVKAVGTETSARVFWVRSDAEAALEHLHFMWVNDDKPRETGEDKAPFAIFPVEVVVLKVPECAACNDSGYADYAAVPCEVCGGKSRVRP